MKGFGYLVSDTCDRYTALQLSIMPVRKFAHITVEPTGIIGKMPAYLMDDTMVDAIRRQVKEHKK